MLEHRLEQEGSQVASQFAVVYENVYLCSRPRQIMTDAYKSTHTLIGFIHVLLISRRKDISLVSPARPILSSSKK